ncbi:MAG: hypothetical protein D6736_06870 [Nitrospinota bacterium]|nr:MAG: hypothetical protein D6736_06870 [Nitrospinota bacterium]
MANPRRSSWLSWLTLCIALVALFTAILAYREVMRTSLLLQDRLSQLQDRWEQYLAQGEERLRLLEALLQKRTETAPTQQE